MEGGGWLVTNTATCINIFLYPDLVTALLGRISPPDWRAGPGEELAVCEVVSLASQAGMLVPGLARLPLPALLAAGGTAPADPASPDPYESRTVEVRESKIEGAGQGLFAIRSAPPCTTLAYFSGEAMAGVEGGDSEYSVAWLGGARLDIPPALLPSYTATLGHKACHSFAPK